MQYLQTILIEKRKEKGLSQAELAKLLHVTKQTVSKWETGKGMPDISMLSAISEILEVSVDELLTGKEPEVKVEIIEKDVVKKPSAQKLIAIILPIVLILVIAITLMSIYIPKLINTSDNNPKYLDIDISGNRAGFDGSWSSNFYQAELDENNFAYYRFKAEFTSDYTFTVTTSKGGKVYFNDIEYKDPPIVMEGGDRIIKTVKYLKAGEEVTIAVQAYATYSQNVCVNMQNNFGEISQIEPHSEYAVALDVENYDYTVVRYLMNSDNNSFSAEGLLFDRLLKLKYIDKSEQREYEEIWNANRRDDTGSEKVFEAVLKPFIYHVYEGYTNILILKNTSDNAINISSVRNHRFIVEDQIEEVEFDKVYEFDFSDDTRYRYYKFSFDESIYLQSFTLCLDRATWGEVYNEHCNKIEIDSNRPLYEITEKDGQTYFAQSYRVFVSATDPKTFYIKVEKASGAEKGRFYLTMN